MNLEILRLTVICIKIQDYNENDQTLISAQNPSNNSPTRKPSQSFTADDFRSAMTSINNSSSNKDLFRMPSFDSASYHNQEFDTQDTSNHFMNENIMNIATTPAYIKQEPVSFNDQNIGNTSNTMDDVRIEFILIHPFIFYIVVCSFYECLKKTIMPNPTSLSSYTDILGSNLIIYIFTSTTRSVVSRILY